MLQPLHPFQTERSFPVADAWADVLVTRHQIAPEVLQDAARIANATGQPLAEALALTGNVSPLSVAQALATHFHAPLIDPAASPPNRALVALWGPQVCLRHGLLPWRRAGACTVILTARPHLFLRQRDDLEAVFGPVRMALATEGQIADVICSAFADHLVARAEARVAAELSSRTWHAGRAMRFGLAFILAMLAFAVLAPVAAVGVLSAIAMVALAAQSLLKGAAILASLRAPPAEANAAIPARLPVITLLVPLYKEKEIASHLMARLQALDYPRHCLDVCLVMEADDKTTRGALGVTNLPTWIRAMTVPQGTLKTKPRALNYALDFARGSIIGVYDAEDAPAPDQLRQVAHRFANRGPKTACLQGVLDFYNPCANWLTRCFTIEYASWFRVMLPGLARLGLVVPLGGTTLFFRRDALEELGAWDAHNVTEDADLGVRLARRGYFTELIATTTEEEANGRPWAWVKQRSRWLKGYAVTYGVHMRDPAALWRDLGAWRFIGFQVLFAGTLLGFLLTPLLMSFWLMALGLPHPMAGLMQGWVFWTVIGLFAASEVINLCGGILGVHRAGKGWLAGWVPTLHFYFPLAALAAYKGVFELAWKPFYWDKTAHGVLMPKATMAPLQPPAHLT